MKMKHRLIFLCIALFFSLFISNDSFCATVNPEPKKGGTLPAISLSVPKDPGEKFYLGLARDGSFKIHQIKAKVVLIKVFNLYCPVCQSTASAMVELFHQIEKHPDFRGKIKLIGIGAGNNEPEIEVFKQYNNIPFPVFPDEDLRTHKALGEVRTPFYIAVRINRDRSLEIVHTHLGGITDIQGLLDSMYEAYGMPREDLQRKEKLATSTANQTSPNSESE
jgi:peroxiredoxin